MDLVFDGLQAVSFVVTEWLEVATKEWTFGLGCLWSVRLLGINFRFKSPPIFVEKPSVGSVRWVHLASSYKPPVSKSDMWRQPIFSGSTTCSWSLYIWKDLWVLSTWLFVAHLGLVSSAVMSVNNFLIEGLLRPATLQLLMNLFAVRYPWMKKTASKHGDAPSRAAWRKCIHAT